MVDIEVQDTQSIVERLRHQASENRLRVTLHGHQEMVEEDISYNEVREALMNGSMLENYPEHQRGACCLVCGQTESGRFLHVVCTTSLDLSIIITVYEPKAPK